MEADCGCLIAPGERYFEHNGSTYCLQHAGELAEYVDSEEGDVVCEYCGEPIDTDYEYLAFDGNRYHEDCWHEFIREESECFGGW